MKSDENMQNFKGNEDENMEQNSARMSNIELNNTKS